MSKQAKVAIVPTKKALVRALNFYHDHTISGWGCNSVYIIGMVTSGGRATANLMWGVF